MRQADFEKRLAKLTATAIEAGLCGGCITLSLLAAVTAVIEGTAGDTLRAHGIGAIVLPVTESHDNTRH